MFVILLDLLHQVEEARLPDAVLCYDGMDINVIAACEFNSSVSDMLR